MRGLSGMDVPETAIAQRTERTEVTLLLSHSLRCPRVPTHMNIVDKLLDRVLLEDTSISAGLLLD